MYSDGFPMYIIVYIFLGSPPSVRFHYTALHCTTLHTPRHTCVFLRALPVDITGLQGLLPPTCPPSTFNAADKI